MDPADGNIYTDDQLDDPEELVKAIKERAMSIDASQYDEIKAERRAQAREVAGRPPANKRRYESPKMKPRPQGFNRGNR